ncbi:hypothetical protein [Gilvibacter sp.]|uniref:hypothetical protein n=1 Tax=Gilvibacter sp. TaxID=2729997 RepID=UPI003F4A77D0
MSKTSDNLARGCLWLVLLLLITVAVFGFLYAFGVRPGIIYFIAVVACSWLVKQMLKPKEELGLNSRIRYRLIFILVVVFCFAGFLNKVAEHTQTYSFDYSEENVVSADTLYVNEQAVPIWSSYRSWKDNAGNAYEGPLRVTQEDYARLKDISAQYQHRGDPELFWGELYAFLESRNEDSLELLFETFALLQQEHQLNQMEFAQMVTTCIQDIPYALVFSGACLPADQYSDETISEVLENCPECCIGNKQYGIQAPVEFIATLKGDCDTRTVLIYSVLKHFDYDVAILNSNFYRHSVLGLNIPASGQYKVWRGKRYYVWETTSKYFRIGQMGASMNDLSHWNIVLRSK